MTCFKIHSITRSLNQDTTEFSLLGQRYRLTARPVQLWKYVHWGKWEATRKARWVIQTPWLTIATSGWFLDSAAIAARGKTLDQRI